MTKGGKRKGSGRKKIGNVVNVRINNDILYKIEKQFSGNSRAEKIRNCLRKGLYTEDGEN